MVPSVILQRSLLGYILKRYRKIPKISPGAYISQRPFLMGLILEGLIFGGKTAFQNRLGLFASQNRLGQLIVGRKFISVICRTVLLNLALRTQTFLKRSNASTLSVWTEEIQTRMKSELRKQQYTVFFTVIIWHT